MARWTGGAVASASSMASSPRSSGYSAAWDAPTSSKTRDGIGQLFAAFCAVLLLSLAVPHLGQMSPVGIDAEAVRRYADRPYVASSQQGQADKKTDPSASGQQGGGRARASARAPSVVASAAARPPADRVSPGRNSRSADRGQGNILKCPNACQGLRCPIGWGVAHAADALCRCVCVRREAVTPWDIERQKQEKKRGRGEQAAASAHQESTDQWMRPISGRSNQLEPSEMEQASTTSNRVNQAEALWETSGTR